MAMHISPEGKIGIFLRLIGLAGAGAIMVAPEHIEIGWGLIVFPTAGLILHHFGIRRGRMIPLIGMILSAATFIGFSGWYFWPVRHERRADAITVATSIAAKARLCSVLSSG